MKTDVIIVGAGPTGLSLASQFIRYGIDFIVLDEKEKTTPFSKATGVQARTLEIYEQIDLADDLIEEGGWYCTPFLVYFKFSDLDFSLNVGRQI